MAQFVVRNVEDDVKERLQRRAARNGRSMEEEVRDILRSAVGGESLEGGLGTRIAARFAGLGLKAEVQELRGHRIRHPGFSE